MNDIEDNPLSLAKLNTKKGLIAIFFMLCKDKRKAEFITNELLRKHKTLEKIIDTKPSELQTMGLKKIEANIFNVLKNFHSFYMRNEFLKDKTINHIKELISFLGKDLSYINHEKFLVVYLNRKKTITAIETISEGTLNKTHIYPRKIIEYAFKHKASSLILVHNHPSGNTMPSQADRELTRFLVNLTDNLDINLMDHVIVSDNNYFSAREFGWVEFLNADNNKFIEIYEATQEVKPTY